MTTHDKGKTKNGQLENRNSPGTLTDAMIDRLVEQAWALHLGQIDAVGEWLVALGGVVILRTEDDWSLRGPSGIVGGFSRGMDPVSCAAMLGFLVLGQFWAEYSPAVMLKVRARWTAAVKQAKAKKKAT